MVKKRNPRVDAQVRDAIADIIETSVADPRLSFVTITEVEVTTDHEHATVYYSPLEPGVLARDPRRTGGDRVPTAAEVADGFEAAAARIQSLVGRRVRLRRTPHLTFKPDPVAEQAKRVEATLKRVRDGVDRPAEGEP